MKCTEMRRLRADCYKLHARSLADYDQKSTYYAMLHCSKKVPIMLRKCAYYAQKCFPLNIYFLKMYRDGYAKNHSNKVWMVLC